MKKLSYLLLLMLGACAKQKAPDEALSPHLHTQEKVLLALSAPVLHSGVTRLEQLTSGAAAVSYRYSGRVSGEFVYTQMGKNIIQLKLVNKRGATTLVLDKKQALYTERGVDLFKLPALTDVEQTDIALALYLYNELAADDLQRAPAPFDPAPAIPLNPSPCQDITMMYFYYTRSGAEYNLNAAVDQFLSINSPHCSRKYGVDAGCLWEDYGCVATQSIECCSAPL